MHQKINKPVIVDYHYDTNSSKIDKMSTQIEKKAQTYDRNIKKTTLEAQTQAVIKVCIFINGRSNYNYIIMWSCPGNMSKYYPGLRDI